VRSQQPNQGIQGVHNTLNENKWIVNDKRDENKNQIKSLTIVFGKQVDHL
jgi:hypothetical protein